MKHIILTAAMAAILGVSAFAGNKATCCKNNKECKTEACCKSCKKGECKCKADCCKNGCKPETCKCDAGTACCKK